MHTVFDELVIDIVKECGMTMYDARKIVNYLRGEGIIDYDLLKEYYSDED